MLKNLFPIYIRTEFKHIDDKSTAIAVPIKP